MFVNGGNRCLTSLQDHKPNFLNNNKASLFNQIKTEVDRISKSISDNEQHGLSNGAF